MGLLGAPNPLPCYAVFVGIRSTSTTEGRNGFAKAQMGAL